MDARIAGQTAARVRIAGISHRSIFKKHADFSHRWPTSQDFRRRFFLAFSCDFRSSEWVFASLAKELFRIASDSGVCDLNRIAHRGCIARFGPLRTNTICLFGAPGLGSPERGHPDLFRFPRFVPTCVPCFLECADFFGFVPITNQNTSGKPPSADPFFQFPDYCAEFLSTTLAQKLIHETFSPKNLCPPYPDTQYEQRCFALGGRHNQDQ